MELPDWLEQFADASTRSRMRSLNLGGAGALAKEAVEAAAQRRGDAEAAAALEGALMKAKGWNALGAFDPAERSRALDLLGFDRQLVFSTFAATQYQGEDLDLLYGGTHAHNRALAAFCEADERLIAVASVPWADPERTLQAVDEAIDRACAAAASSRAPCGSCRGCAVSTSPSRRSPRPSPHCRRCRSRPRSTCTASCGSLRSPPKTWAG